MKTTAIMNLKGGVAKTITAVNMAAILAEKHGKRVLKAIDAAGVADDVYLPWEYYGSYENTVGNIRKWAEGNFDGSGDWYAPRLEPEKLEKPMETCKLLKCSADFLLGLTDELHGGGEIELRWKNPEDKPVIDRIVVAKFKLPGAEQTKTMLAKWDGDLWCFPSDAPIDSLCIGWWPVPEEEQS